jgi:hypothetical protein
MGECAAPPPMRVGETLPPEIETGGGVERKIKSEINIYVYSF